MRASTGRSSVSVSIVGVALGDGVPALVPLLDAVELDAVVVTGRGSRPDTAFALEPLGVVVFHVVAHPLGWGYVEVGVVAGEVYKDDGHSVLDDGAVGVELPG